MITLQDTKRNISRAQPLQEAKKWETNHRHLRTYRGGHGRAKVATNMGQYWGKDVFTFFKKRTVYINA